MINTMPADQHLKILQNPSQTILWPSPALKNFSSSRSVMTKNFGLKYSSRLLLKKGVHYWLLYCIMVNFVIALTSTMATGYFYAKFQLSTKL